jgi:acetyl esterase/lipase
MRRVKSIFKNTGITVIVLLLASLLIIAGFLFANNAPITSGTMEYGIVYKNDLNLDLYLPTKEVFNTSPVVFYVHGGAWIRGSKTAINFNRFNGAINILRENGYTIIAPNYSLAGETKSVFPDCILDLYEAIDWTKKNASRYGLDTTNLGLLGESAGAHIAMMVAFSDTTLQPEKYGNTEFNYLIDVYGPNDLTDIYRGHTVESIDASIKKVSRIFGSDFSIKEYVFGFDPSKDSVRANDLLNRFSPINILGRNKIPVLIIHGKNDRIVPVQQSISLKQKLDTLGIPNELYLMDETDHTFINATGQQRDSVQIWISDFIISHYKK